MKKKSVLGSNPLFNLDKSIFDVAMDRGNGPGHMNTLDFHEIDIESISPNPFQPRRNFPVEEIKQLSESIIQHGVIQPILVRPMHGKYQLVAGERRWRAVQKAKISKIPALVKNLDDQSIAGLALVENLHRKGIPVIEQSRALDKMRKEFGLDQTQLAHIINSSRSHVTNLLRLLNLNQRVQSFLEEEKLNMGHARALISLPSYLQSQLAEKIIKLHLSVRQTEGLVNNMRLTDTKKSEIKPTNLNLDSDIKLLEKRIANKMGSTVKIYASKKGKGKILIEFTSLDCLDDILLKMGLK